MALLFEFITKSNDANEGLDLYNASEIIKLTKVLTANEIYIYIHI